MLPRKPTKTLEFAIRIVVLVLLAVSILSGLGGLVLLVFVPVIGWYVWRLNDRATELERRVAELEKKSG